MKTTAITDKFAIGLSMLCAIHCLVLPILLALLPSLAAFNLHDEAFHKWMLIAVIPTSLYALTMGCKKHHRYHLLVLGMLGLTLMVSALCLDHDMIGETGEKTLTLIGAMLVAGAHLINFKRCRSNKSCRH
ncbi:MerC domain-containing protein [Thalassotalea agariperforans]